MKTLLPLLVLPLLAASPGSPAPQESALELDSIAWMAGHWRQKSDRGVTEELWMPPSGGLMLGLNRTVGAKGKAQFEYLRIEKDAKAVVYQASPGGAKPTPFRLVKADKAHAVFENPEHDFPKRIEYRLQGDKLVASIAGDEPGPSWTFERVGDVR